MNTGIIDQLRQTLIEEEKASATIEKYVRDVRAFFAFLGEQVLSKEQAMAYKQNLMDSGYAQRSINGVIASLNKLFSVLDRKDCCLRSLKIQRQIFRPEEQELTKAEYLRLVRTAEANRNHRLSLLLQTICATGMRVSELPFVTVEAVRCGKVVVSCKGKVRTVFLVRQLQKRLLAYVKEMKIKSGSIFISRTGKPMNRSNIWREMKALCELAQVNPEKVFPHNLRHLFARIFYGLQKDIVKLADVLGHSSINTTRIYVMTTGEEHRRHMETMHLVI